MSLTSGAKTGSNPVTHSIRPQAKVSDAAPTQGKPPVLKSSERTLDPVLEQQVESLDAFIEGSESTYAAIVARLQTVARQETPEQLLDAARSMRVFAVRLMWEGRSHANSPRPALAVNANVRTFARLWAAASQQEHSGKSSRAPGTPDLDFGPAFSRIINIINGAEVSLRSRK